jgi:hypothetical protein
MTEQTVAKGNSKKGQDQPSQLNMRVFEADARNLEQIQSTTGLVVQSEIMRYALKFTADRHPAAPPIGDITPALIHDIAGLTAMLKTFAMEVANHMDKEAEEYRHFIMSLLAHIGDPTEICALLAEHLPEERVVLCYSHATHLQYEYATECLIQNGISLDERILEAEQHRNQGRKAFHLYLDDLVEVYADLINRYDSPGAYASFVSRLRRYARGMLCAF